MPGAWGLGRGGRCLPDAIFLLKKLRVKSRVDLAATFDAERSTRFDLTVGDESLAVVGVDVALSGKLADKLTSAERAIAACVARGWSNARIAAERGVAPSTVAKQLQTIYDKLGVENRTRLARVLADGG